MNIDNGTSKMLDAYRSNRYGVFFSMLLCASVVIFLPSLCQAENVTNKVDVITDVVAATNYTTRLFSRIDCALTDHDFQEIAKTAHLKGVRLMAAAHLDASLRDQIVLMESPSVTSPGKDSGLVIGCFHLGMNIEDAFALMLSRHPDVGARLYLEDGVLCIADANGQDLAWANADICKVHWMTFTPPIVRKIFDFKTGTFDDLRRTIEKRLSISFAMDRISKGDVSQQIGNIDTVDGETLRYFVGAISNGEDVRRSVRKVVNQHIAESDPMNGGIGAMFANAIEDEMQSAENAKSAQSPRFAPRGSLQLQLTKNAVQGDWNASGGSVQSGSSMSPSDYFSLGLEIESALNQLNSLSL